MTGGDDVRPSFFIAPNGGIERPAFIAHQRGVSLLIVLIALVIMSLAAVGLIRMVDTGSLVIGNLAFKQSTTSATDAAVETAIAWLVNPANDLKIKNDAGYFATSLSELDATGNSGLATRALIDWDDDDCAYAAAGTFAACLTPTAENSVGSYTTRHVIARMCKTEGDADDAANSCIRPVSNGGNPPPLRDSPDYTNYIRFGTTAGPYYRIIVRSVGPRNTVSFTETYVHF
jgi:type IV pilus assembly protein PilX